MPNGRPRFFDSALFGSAMKLVTRAHFLFFRPSGGPGRGRTGSMPVR